jgi:hypothetical protein
MLVQQQAELAGGCTPAALLPDAEQCRIAI